MSKSSFSHFKPNFKPLAFRSPHWVITNYFSKVQLKMVNHPFFARFSKKRQTGAPPAKPKLG